MFCNKNRYTLMNFNALSDLSMNRPNERGAGHKSAEKRAHRLTLGSIDRI